MVGFHKARLVVFASALSVNLILSAACLAQSVSECEKRTEGVYKIGGESKYYVGAAFSSPLTGSEKAVADFYKKAFNRARYWSITTCGSYVNASEVARLPNFQPPACDKDWGTDRVIFLRSAVIQSRAQFDQLVRQTCKLEAPVFKMAKFGLIPVNPQPEIMFGPPPSKSNK